jgi:hypothetical protein
MTRSRLKQFVLVLGVLISAPTIAAADESGVSFWIPGFFGSLAAAPMQPGWTLQTNYYHTSVSAGADVARSLDIRIGRIPINLNANVSATVDARADLGWAMPLYTFATPVLGGQATVGVLGLYGRLSTSIAGTLAGTLTTPLGTTPFASSANTSDSVSGFGDVLPIATLRWNAGAHNYMTYITGDVPVGAYDSTRISNIGLGHGTIDAGGGYTYFDPQTGHEFSGILGFTYNFENQSDQYQSGVDMHFDWSVSQFVTKQFQIGAVGYVYKEIGCDSGSGDRVGCFQSQVVGVGPQLGFIFPVGDLQGYLNLKYYSEFAAENRPHGWNTWVTFTISPAAPSPSTSTPKRIITK